MPAAIRRSSIARSWKISPHLPGSLGGDEGTASLMARTASLMQRKPWASVPASSRVRSLARTSGAAAIRYAGLLGEGLSKPLAARAPSVISVIHDTSSMP
jgi:hypothetical protein